jgi:carboxymethylenebutenolidase
MHDDMPFERTRDYALSRRGLAALSLGAVASASAMAAVVSETDITIKMPDGDCDAALFHPAGDGRWPGIVIFADALGLRPTFRDMGRRLAAEGYVVVVPNPFYRTRKAPVLSGPFDFSKAEDRAKLVDLMAPLNITTKTSDGKTYVAFLDTQQQMNKGAKIGVVGYCMGGAYTLFTAAAVSERVGAGVSLHGGNLVIDNPDSPHLLVPKIKASFYFGIATNDDQKQPEANPHFSH